MLAATAAMPRAGLTTDAVVDAALAVVDDAGMEALTLTAVAERTGVATPSLYKHVGGLVDLRILVAERVAQDLTARLTSAVIGRSGDDAVTAIMQAYRAYVAEFPARYAAMPPDLLHHPLLADVGHEMIGVCLAVLRGYGLDGSDAVHATRCLRAIGHGFASIEASGGFGLPEDVDATYDRLIHMFLASLPGRDQS